ncbi:FAD-dependent oxidoreductase [Polyangium jinanense]|uniref:FAD-dependent oxidoreductase n=1 Tax=Polyangium jinanense TaxID=2829994 RepID=A0A9X3XD53_9BACT|nr:FAD-dependent oxidoreductase [Polyangium jinanense]MDC3985886.1 FAD-dependent oxidoreductase [Polyangium jinanense]
MDVIRTDVAIIGGGLGACAAALAAARMGLRVVLTEETRWLGGQLTNQAVPPDEHPWIEEHGANRSYRALRDGIRQYYRRNVPLSAAAKALPTLNPGNGWVSRLCHDPRIAVAVLHEMIAPYRLNGSLFELRLHRPISAWTHGDRVTGVVVRGRESGRDVLLEADYFIDATPHGELLALAGVEHVLGQESRGETGEPHAAEAADPRAQQAITVCFAMEHLPGEDHTIDKPRQYDFWRAYEPQSWPGRLLDWTTVRPETLEPLRRGLFAADDGHPWWTFRRILDKDIFEPGFARSDVTIVNWPQNDYWLGPVCGVDAAEAARNEDAARQLSLSLLYWLQTEAPRPDGGVGYRGLRLRADVVGGTADGLAPAPYIRESRRIRAEFTVLEQHIAYPLRPDGPAIFDDSVGIGCYRIDLHPRVGGAGYLDLGCWPFQIPLGALIPVRMENLLPGGKNLGTTHITNGAFRVHPVEWSVGEAAGLLATFCLERRVLPREVHARKSLREELQTLLLRNGVELAWPKVSPL